MGIGVATPWGDSERYDFIIDAGGRLLKVQIKSAHCVSAARSGGYHIRRVPIPNFTFFAKFRVGMLEADPKPGGSRLISVVFVHMCSFPQQPAGPVLLPKGLKTRYLT
jgi:hypothetical protein